MFGTSHVYERTGTLWGRFKSGVVDAEAYLLTCQRYIELDPVRAGLVGRPEDCRWSIYHANPHGISSRRMTRAGSTRRWARRLGLVDRAIDSYSLLILLPRPATDS